MALIQVDFVSESLNRTVPVRVILPAEKAQPPYKTIYLLHGVLGNETDWVNGTNIQRWAEEKEIAVVMPAGENSFYLDDEKAYRFYGRYIGEELVKMTRKIFPLSTKREDTYLAGLSMGGYGALRNGLKYSETFGGIAAFSAALFMDEMPEWDNSAKDFFRRKDFAESIFGDLTKVKDSDKDPVWLVKKLLEDKKEIPEIYMACGTKDSLLEANRRFRNELSRLKVNLTYEESDGGHEWDFWNRYIGKFIKRL